MAESFAAWCFVSRLDCLALCRLAAPPFFGRAPFATVILVRIDGVAIVAQINHPPAIGTVGRLKRRRVFQLVKVEFVGAIPNIHFDFGKTFPTFRAVLPAPGVMLVVVMTAQRIPAVIAMT